MTFQTQIQLESLSEDDLNAVDRLGSRYKKTIGFLTKETLRDYLKQGRVLGARTLSGELIGYLLYADYPDRFRIGQLCVAEEHRGEGIARSLVDRLKEQATTQKLIKLRCRRDFKEASKTWKALGFIPLDEKPGRSAEGHLLTLWCYQLSHDDELGLWTASATDDTLDITIDAHIFYDFDAEVTPSSEISKALLNDFLVDSLNFWITDELFVEIGRQEDDEVRARSLLRAQGMNRIMHDRKLADDFTALLKDILSYDRDSDKSDIHHIAKTAASDVKTFVTKDEKILRRAPEIKSVTDVTVVHPVDLVGSIHEVAERQNYSPSLVSGLSLRWVRMKGEDLAHLDLATFQNSGENNGILTERLRVFLANPVNYNCQTLQSDGVAVALRVLALTEEVDFLEVPFARISNATDTGLFGNFLLADTLAYAVAENCFCTEFLKEGLSVALTPILRRMEFTDSSSRWIKFTLCHCCDRQNAETTISQRAPSLISSLVEIPELEFERMCAPLASNPDLSTFLVPIVPSFAMGLIDQDQAANDLFGGNGTSLLRWENVYYRRKSRHKMLQAPARILWYVSDPRKAIIAVSHLDEVHIGKPKELFSKFRKFGVLEWRDLYKMCGQDLETEIMALKFSRTFLFRHPVSLSDMRNIFTQDGISESLQSPSKIPFNTLAKIYTSGFSTQ